MFTEDELLPVSALQHLVFCERQCALIHLERSFEENALTIEGQLMHRRVHEAETEIRGELRVARGLPIRSFRLGLVGVVDVVELHRVDGPDSGAAIHGLDGRYAPHPIEYKRGRPKKTDCDKIQLCAQALCLEEMLGVAIPAGALYYGRIRRRLEIAFDPSIRAATEQAVARLHQLFAQGRTPPAHYSQRCDNCSLVNLCLPKVAAAGRSVRRYLDRMLGDLGEP